MFWLLIWNHFLKYIIYIVIVNMIESIQTNDLCVRNEFTISTNNSRSCNCFKSNNGAITLMGLPIVIMIVNLI